MSENKELKRIAEEGGHSLAQVCIAWGVRRGYPVLPKSGNPARIQSNFQTYDMPDSEFEAVQKVAEGRNNRFVNMKDTFGLDIWPNESEDGVKA